MERMPFVFTILFLLLGPIRLIPAFAQLTHEAEPDFKRAVAVRGLPIVAGICVFVAFMGDSFVRKYHFRLESVEIAGGLLLLLSAINAIFPGPVMREANAVKPSPIELALSPLATPMIVSPMGVAAILIFVMLGNREDGIGQAIALSLAIILVLDFLVMFFIDLVVRIPGLFPVLRLLDAVLLFIQVALAVNTIIAGLDTLGLFRR